MEIIIEYEEMLQVVQNVLDLRKQIEEFMKKMSGQADPSASHLSQIYQYENTVKSLQEENESLKEEVNSIHNDRAIVLGHGEKLYADSKTKIDDLKKEISNLKKQRKEGWERWKEIVSKCNIKERDFIAERDGAKVQEKGLLQRIKNLVDENVGLKKKYVELSTSDYAHMIDRVGILVGENEKLYEKSVSTQQQLSACCDISNQLHVENDHLKKRIQGFESYRKAQKRKGSK